MLKGVIFDLDGTLADTLPVCFAAFRRALHEQTGRIYTNEEITALFGPSEEGSFLLAAPGRVKACMRVYLEEYERVHEDCRELFQGVPEAFDLLEEHGVLTAIVTGKGAHSAAISLRMLGIEGRFGLVETGSEQGPVKPQAISRILAQWGLPAESVAYVGDAPTDVTSARQVGVLPLAAAWAKTADYQALKSMEPEEIFSTVSEFIDWLRGHVPAV